MDGTLLDGAGLLDKDFYNIYSALNRREILFCAASGRQLYNLQQTFSPISDQMAFIAENGSFVVSNGSEVFVQAMDKQVVRDMIRLARTVPGVQIVLSGKAKAYVENTTADFMQQVDLYYDRKQVVNDLIEVNDDEFLKIAICDFSGSETNSYPFFKHMEDRLQVKISGKIWLDLSHPLANKGVALKRLQEQLGIGQEETMVFGDYLNDLEMMQEAWFSYAMENAHEQVKAVSRFRAESNINNGVGKILVQVIESIAG